MARNGRASVIEVGVARALMEWVVKGDAKYIELYMLYIFGKPKELEIPKDPKTGQPAFDELTDISDAELRQRVDAITERLKKEAPKP